MNYKIFLRVVLILITYHLSLITSPAQGISVSAPTHVQTGENFRVEYHIETQDVSDFKSGLQNNEWVEVIAGPSTSKRASIQMVNGHMSNNSSVTYTYILYAQKGGTVTLPAAHARVGSKTLSSKPVKVTISGSASHPNNAPQMHQDRSGEQEMRPSGSPISGNDLFIKVSANKQRVHEQEPVLLTYKVFTLVDLIQLEGKMPDLTGFHTQEVELPQQKSFHMETLNGRNYKCVTWKQYVMYPQMTGKLDVPSIMFTGTVVQRNRSVDPFESFFNGGSDYTEVKREIKAPGITLQVDPLPQRPKDFSGGVGRFNISAKSDRQEVKAGEPVTIHVVIEGEGNLKLLKEPVLNLPRDFDKYDPKTTDNTRLTLNGVEGSMAYDFLVVPRHQGSYTIDPVQLVYYDTGANAYKTIQTSPITLKVRPGDSKGAVGVDSDESIRQDIYPIKTNETRSSSLSTLHSPLYWLLTGILLCAFIAVPIVFSKRAARNADLVQLKGRRARKVAAKRLKKASRLMSEGRHDAFYDEVLRALWGYMSDKLNIPVEKLSTENINAELSAHQVDEATTRQFIGALDECEFERYAPGDPAGNMSKTFEAARSAILKIEETILVFLLLLSPCLGAFASSADKQIADSAYLKGNYQQAAVAYEKLLQNEKNADIYYNLGNTYYRSGNIGKAILAYERSLRLSPDADTRFNLQFVRRKTIDQLPESSEMFFVTAYKTVRRSLSSDAWAVCALCALAIALLLQLVYLFSPRLGVRRVAFFGAIAAIVIFLLALFFAWQQKRYVESNDEAIVMPATIQAMRTPATDAATAFSLHEGTKVRILDRTMADWRQIRLSDGREAWVKTKQIEEI